MDRRVVSGLIVVGLIGTAGIVGFAAMNATGDPTYTPDTLAGHERTANITGAEAEAIIAELHRQPAAVAGFEQAIVATYGGDGRENAPITIYASVHATEDDAAENITRMVEAMDRSPALAVENTTVETQTVYTVEGDGVAFAFFSYRDTAYWVTHTREIDAETTDIVREILTTNRESRTLLPSL